MAIVGIDLGTTNSVLSMMEGGRAIIIPNAEGGRVTPSVVAYTAKDGILVGDLARRQSLLNPAATVFSIKRFMGKRFDEVKDLQRSHLPYETCDQLNGDLGVRIDGKIYSPSEISAQILSRLKANAEQYLGQSVDEAVITVPAYFNDAERRATQVAGEIAGFKVRRIINEPTAAALAYGAERTGEEKLAVFDFGGGTFDISILEIGDGIIEVLATHGDSHLGGDDIDRLIADYLFTSFEAAEGISVREDALIFLRVLEAAEKAKMELSSMVETEVYLPFLTATNSGPKHLRVTLTRAQLDAMIEPLIGRAIECCKQAMTDAKIKVSDLDQILLVGGSTRVPLVQAEVERFFGKKANHSLNPDEVVALGAAIQGGVLTGEVSDIVLLDVTPLTLGVEANGGLMIPIIERNTTIPTKKTKLFSTTVDNQDSVVISVFQGERDFAEQNRRLGQFELADIEAAPRAVPQIEVAFDIDANGVLTVQATNKKSNKQEKLVLMGAGGLTDDEIRSAIVDAETSKDEDTARRLQKVTKNKTESFIFSISRARRELGSAATDDLIARSTALLERAQAELADEAFDAESYEALNVELSSCSREWSEIGYALEAQKVADAEAAERATQTPEQGDQAEPNQTQAPEGSET